jgi:hypothetical protein
MTKQFIDGCTVCQQMKTNTHPTAAPLMLIKSHAHRPFQQVTMDFITDLPISNGFDSIFIVVDQGLSKGVILCPCNKTIDAEGTIKLYIDNVFIQYGLPDVIISDRGPQFASNVFNGIFDTIGVKHRMSTAYHPQTDGQTERYNQDLEAYLRIYCAYKPNEWNNKLSLAQFAHNARTHEAIKQSPFQLMYGTKPMALPEVSEKTNSPVANNRINQLYKSREEALAAHDLARIKMMERTTNRTKPFKVNDQVWLESKNLKIPYQSRKLAPKREGPFKIKEVLGPVTYRYHTDDNTSLKHKNTRFALPTQQSAFTASQQQRKPWPLPPRPTPPTPSRRLTPGPPPPHPPGSHGLPPLSVAYPLRCHHIHTARYPPSGRARARSDS